MASVNTPSRLRADELEAILRKERGFLFRLARSQLRDDSTADDVVQDMALAAWQSIERFEKRSSIRSWLVGILRFKILDALREQHRQPASFSSLDVMQELQSLEDALLFDAQERWAEMPQVWWIETAGPSEALVQQQMMQFLELCLKNLPQRTAQIFLMREYLGFESPEIAARTGLQAGHVRVILLRARLALRSCLDLRISGQMAPA